MKISKLFHWLYATLMFLPLLVAPIFGIYSHRHTIDSYSIEVPNYQKVNFNQIRSNEYIDYTFESESASQYRTFGVTEAPLHNNHIYYVKITNLQLSGNIWFKLGNPSYNDLFTTITTTDTQIKYRATYQVHGAEYNAMYFQYINNYSDFIFQYENMNVYDLTQMFGSGNEPSITEFDALFPDDSYAFSLSKAVLVENGTQVYNDTDIGSQFVYTIYGTLDKYFNFSKVFGLNHLGEYMYTNWFYGNSYIGFSCFFLLLTYWLLISLCWLIFDLLMYVPNLVHRWLDRGAIQ